MVESFILILLVIQFRTQTILHGHFFNLTGFQIYRKDWKNSTVNILTCFTLIHQFLTFCSGNILKIVHIMIFILCMVKYLLQRIMILVYMTSTIIKHNKANIYLVMSSNRPYLNFFVSKMSYRPTFSSIRSSEIHIYFLVEPLQ